MKPSNNSIKQLLNSYWQLVRGYCRELYKRILYGFVFMKLLSSETATDNNKPVQEGAPQNRTPCSSGALFS